MCSCEEKNVPTTYLESEIMNFHHSVEASEVNCKRPKSRKKLFAVSFKIELAYEMAARSLLLLMLLLQRIF